MFRFFLNRFGATLPTLLGMSFVAFAIVTLAPGDPVQMELRAMGVVPKPEDIAAIKAEYGLDKPFLARYIHWLWRAVQLDFGTSIATGRSVIEEIGLYLPATLMLAISSLVGSIVISLFLGALAIMGNRLTASLLRAITILLVSIPSFWLALILIHVFILNLGWSRLVGEGDLSDLILPALTLSLGAGASLGRLVYERVRAEACEDYVRLAIAKGISPLGILISHIAPRIIGPLVTVWATTLGWMLGGAVIVESIFGWPGLGQLILQAIGQRDYPVIQGYLVLMGLVFVTTSLIADLVVVVADPQLRRRLHRD
ncbi:ABC transporter permease [Cohaesibacter gelatinilyticus]|uniref:Peptide/nickel transport system permease protein n=1 Tax=Cohaesibacter gelatinilyticus TaxID=372072 RepID=A0A285PCI9_9HYPH|nr:ABC transporter permease [Cohaesibacter gelatinilyticus]SNZ19460.1 peptide/nickel transport system permease protein [Cohaesibacter gelatinilyticus]